MKCYFLSLIHDIVVCYGFPLRSNLILACSEICYGCSLEVVRFRPEGEGKILFYFFIKKEKLS